MPRTREEIYMSYLIVITLFSIYGRGITLKTDLHDHIAWF